MHKQYRVLAVVPARGGSKGIPQKNIKPLAGKPLIRHVLDTLRQTIEVDRIVVSTEDAEIRRIAEAAGYEVHMRPEQLSGDAVTLDEVVAECASHYADYELVLTVQTTSPLLRTATVSAAVRLLADSGKNTVLTLKDATKLYWGERNDRIVPLYEARRNRQYLPPQYAETGAIFGCRADFLRETGSRIDPESAVPLLTSETEAVDIDTYDNWVFAERLLAKPKVAVHVIGNTATGLGHVYRQLTLALYLPYEVDFFVTETHAAAADRVRRQQYRCEVVADEAALLRRLKDGGYTLVINDILDTDRGYMSALKDLGLKVINFEDLGDGRFLSDLCFNSLYEFSHTGDPNTFYGYQYCCLRYDVLSQRPKSAVAPEVGNVLISCGGVDINNLSLRYLRALKAAGYQGHIRVVLGPGYQHEDELKDWVASSGLDADVVRDLPSMAAAIAGADLALTSNGRTVYEVASLGVPLIVISQNERELHHTFSKMAGGVRNLGLAEAVSDEAIVSSLQSCLGSAEMRAEARERLLSFNLKDGVRNILDLMESVL